VNGAILIAWMFYTWGDLTVIQVELNRVIQWINYLDLEEDKKRWIISEMVYHDTRLDNGRIQ